MQPNEVEGGKPSLKTTTGTPQIRELFIEELAEVRGGSSSRNDPVCCSTMACCEEGQCCNGPISLDDLIHP
jgi:hypothetical protein